MVGNCPLHRRPGQFKHWGRTLSASAGWCACAADIGTIRTDRPGL